MRHVSWNKCTCASCQDTVMQKYPTEAQFWTLQNCTQFEYMIKLHFGKKN